MSTYPDKIYFAQDATPDTCFYFPKKKTKLLLLLIAVVGVFLMYQSPEAFSATNEIVQEFLFEEKKVYNILFWTRFFGHHDWYAQPNGNAGAELLKKVNCPVTNCFFTHRKIYMNLTEFDAIMFHAPEVLAEIPIRRSPHQLYIFVSLEAPTFIYENLTKYEDFYNLTMTFRMDSDVEWDYGKILDSQTNKTIAPSKNPEWKVPDDNFFDENLMKMYEGKSKSIVWFVSNCRAFSKRHFLVRKMQEFIDIDIYGKCGNLTCSGPDCEKMLSTTYKFYLSFENSLCKDYVTEKLFRSLNEYSIPIVYNGAKDMSLFAPPKSVISVNDYDSVEDLVKYLKHLMDNPREYIKYFWWKQHYKVVPHPVYPYTLCDLCKKLNDKEFMSKEHRYGDINAWARDNMCNQSDHRIKF